MSEPTEHAKSNKARFHHANISEIETGLMPGNFTLYLGGTAAARDLELLRKHNISIVVNCAVNLDINYVVEPNESADGEKCAHGTAPLRVFKLGLVDGTGNAEMMMLSGYYLLDGATRQNIPDKKSYPHRDAGNVLVHCRGGRSRSTALASLYLHVNCPLKFPTLDDAVAHVRKKRGLHPDEWYSAPKPVLIDAARQAREHIHTLSKTGLKHSNQVET